MNPLIPKNADYLIEAYKDERVLISTWHQGVTSRNTEIDIYILRMVVGEIDYIVVHDHNVPSYKLYPDGRSETL